MCFYFKRICSECAHAYVSSIKVKRNLPVSYFLSVAIFFCLTILVDKCLGKHKDFVTTFLHILKAKKLGYESRAVYKLKQIKSKYNILKRVQNQSILDLGCTPGS